MIQDAYAFLEKMNSSNSSNDKVEEIRNCSSEIRKLLYYTYNPFIQFYVRPKTLIKKKDLVESDESKYNSIFEILDALSTRIITGNRAIKAVNTFIDQNKECKDLLYLVLERNLKIRVSVKLINKAIPGLIPEFNVALANKLDEKTIKKVNLEECDWFISRKLDGVRCLVYINERGKATSYARSGKVITTIPNVEKELVSLGVKNVIYDGELCMVDDNGNEDFQNIMKEVGRKDHVIKNCDFKIFDFVPYSIFKKGTSTTGKLSERLYALEQIVSFTKTMSPQTSKSNISILKQDKLVSFDMLEERKKEAADRGWEGLMLRKDSTYNGKRSYDILKVKAFHDSEYKVEDVIFNKIRHVVEGKEVEDEMLSGVVITHKDNCVRVGSGFTIEQRKYFYENPKEIIGKTITVQYFEESKNQLGEFSLRFPVVKSIHGEEREF